MTLSLQFIAEAKSGLSRLYRNADGVEQWIPRSVCPSTFKHPPIKGQATLHEVTIEDWWLEKNPFPVKQQKELKL